MRDINEEKNKKNTKNNIITTPNNSTRKYYILRILFSYTKTRPNHITYMIIIVN